MTLDEKTKCSELWQMASGEYIAPTYWTRLQGTNFQNSLHKFRIVQMQCPMFPGLPVHGQDGAGL